MKFVLGINASNLSSGGGFTHLLEFVSSKNEIIKSNIKIVVWASEYTLSKLPNYKFLIKKSHFLLNQGSLSSLFWQTFFLTSKCRKENIDVLFSPGGSYSQKFSPSVVMSQNMLPFELDETKKYKISLTTIRILLLRFLQSRAFASSEGIIFLSRHAKKVIGDTIKLKARFKIIRHGVAKRFFQKPKSQKNIYINHSKVSFRLIYVSKLDVYKNHDTLIEAVNKIRLQTGWDLKLDLVGPSYHRILKKIEIFKNTLDKDKTWLFYHGNVSYDELHKYYHNADLGVFLSSCENLPITLIEKMAAGLPIVSSNRGPMPEILGDFAFFCNPEDVKSVENAVYDAIRFPEKRTKMVKGSYKLALKYSWADSTSKTIKFLKSISKKDY